MNSPLRAYVALLFVFLLSAALATILPTNELLTEIAALPAVCSLLAAVYQITRDRAAFDRQQFLQKEQNAFSLGATSHMANVAFDKHVAFCESYVQEVHATVNTLFREGPTAEAMKHVISFADLRRQYAAWLPADIARQLQPFEKTVTEIGTLSTLVKALEGSDDPKRSEAIEQMYDAFREVMDIPRDSLAARKPEVAAEAVKEKIRQILGIEQLTQLRRRLISQALAAHVSGRADS
jgi:hypothetical protein